MLLPADPDHWLLMWEAQLLIFIAGIVPAGSTIVIVAFVCKCFVAPSTLPTVHDLQGLAADCFERRAAIDVQEKGILANVFGAIEDKLWSSSCLARLLPP